MKQLMRSNDFEHDPVRPWCGVAAAWCSAALLCYVAVTADSVHGHADTSFALCDVSWCGL